jgi:tetratricopeptide (TPR) repeat protein
MLYLLIALCSHSQLVRLRGDSLPGIEEGLRDLLSGWHARVAWRSGGSLLASCGPDAGQASELALKALGSLREQRESLFGFSLVLEDLPAAPDDEEARRLADEALALEPEEELWVSPAAAGLFDGVLEIRPHGSLFRVLGRVAGRAAAAAPGQSPAPVEGPGLWMRGPLVERCLDLLARRLNDSESRTVLFLHGPAGAGKTTLLAECARRLGCIGAAAPLRAYALFRRRTPLHPFLNSLDAGFLSEVPALLTGAERSVWEDLGGILTGIVSPGVIGAVPDQIVTDFLLAYRLFARAWARRAARALVPAILVCEDVESWHPAAREAAGTLAEDLLAEPSVIVVVTSALEALPPELAELETAALPVQPLGRREIRSFAHSLYPGLELPEAVVRRIRKRSGGLPVPVMSFLRYLECTGSIRAEEGREPVSPPPSGVPARGYAWVQEQGGVESLPADPLSVSWYLIRSLADDSFLLLYALYLAAGLLDRQGLLDFLGGEGFDRREADESLAALLASGLVAEEECLVPRYPGLRRRLEELLGEDATRLSDRFADHLLGLWTRGAYHREVLLFSYLAKAGRTDDALRVLPGIVRRKIDECDMPGARAFTDPARLEFVRPPDAAGRTVLGVVCTAGRLRAAVIEERLEEAGGIVRELARFGRDAPGPVLAAEAGLAAARYYLAVGDSASALDALKRGLTAAQDAGAGGTAAVREASLLLGATMLADGRLGEAVEYAGLAEREAQEAGDRLAVLRAGSLLASCHFLEGRLTRAEECAGEALALAAAMGQRHEEIFLDFVQARVRFLLGDYEGCSVSLQRCLCLSELYRMAAAEPVLDAWVARSMVYAGNATAGTSRLERLESTREVLLFQAEAALFDGDLAGASLAVERGMAMPADSAFPPPYGGRWRDGFLALEGRCFSLARSGTCLQRQLAALRGHLLARRGSGSDAVRELGELVRSVRPADNDPSLPLYLFLYADALPEESGDDDKVTVLAKALKGLQERASRIDAPAERSAFLRANRWNRTIMEEARVRRLA